MSRSGAQAPPRPRDVSRGVVVRLLRRAEDAGEVIAGVALWGIVALLFFQVVGRYVLKTGLSWPDELARYLHIVIVFVTLGAVARLGLHIRIDLFRRKLQSRVLDRLTLLIELGAALVLAAGAAEIIRRLGLFRTPALAMPLALFFLPSALGFAAMALESVRRSIAHWTGAIEVDAIEVGPTEVGSEAIHGGSR